MTYGVVTRLRACVAALAVVGVSLFALTGSASAETYTASNTTQLEEAVAKANATTGANTIVLSGGGYLPLTTLRFTNTTGLQTIEGPSARPTAKLEGTAVEPFPSELFSIGAGVSVAFKKVLVSHSGGPGAPAIEDIGNFTVEDSTIAGNKGIGVIVTPGATLSATNSTISDGSAGGVVDGGTASFLNDTVAFNKGVGIENKGVVNLANTIVAENGGGNCAGKASSSDHSLDSDGSCGVGALSATNPLLGPVELDGDGGPTPIHSLKPGSPAIEAGDEAVCPSTDQRGFPRPGVPGTPCDIGAEEWNPYPPTITVPSEITTVQTSPAGAVVTYTATATPVDSVLRSFSCTPASGSTFAVGTTTVTCTATDGHENTATASFQVTVLYHVAFVNWLVEGRLNLHKVNQPVILPAGSTFNGSANLNFITLKGPLTGSIFVPPFSQSAKVFGVPVSVGLEFSEAGAIGGSVGPSKTVEGDLALGAPYNTNIHVTSLNIFGITIPTKCVTAEPVSFALLTNLTLEEFLTGWHFAGTTTIPTVKCEGTLGTLEGAVFTGLFSGPNNTYSIAITPPA
jgi:HYR domain